MPYEEFDEEFYEEFDEEFEEEFNEEFEEDEFVTDFEELADAAMAGDEDAEDEFLGALAGIAAKALPTIAGSLVPKVLKWGKKLIRGKSRRILRAAPGIVKRATRIIARKPRTFAKRPKRISMVLTRVTKTYIPRRI